MIPQTITQNNTQNPSCVMFIPRLMIVGSASFSKAGVSITVTWYNLFYSEPCRKQFHQKLSGWLIFLTSRWGLDQLCSDWMVCSSQDAVRSSAGSLSTQLTNQSRTNYFFPLSNYRFISFYLANKFNLATCVFTMHRHVYPEPKTFAEGLSAPSFA